MKRSARAWLPLCLLCLWPAASAQEPAPDAAEPAPDAGAPAPDAGAPAPNLELGPPVGVVFQLNDSMVKDRVVAGVRVELRASPEAAPMFSGDTGADGKLALRVPSGRWLVSYHRQGYVPLVGSPTEIQAEGQVITTTLSMLLESTGNTGRKRIQIVLNWGSDRSQVKDADSHLACACGQGHVYYGSKVHSADDPRHEVNLDVDDMDWGGPETVTILDPIPGSYTYWVHNYSGSPSLGASAVVVRVILDDAVAGEYPIPGAWDAPGWRPFKAIVVGADGLAQVEPFSEAELRADAARVVPEGTMSDLENCESSCVAGGVAALILLGWVISLFVKRR